jgi:O-antigen ligase
MGGTRLSGPRSRSFSTRLAPPDTVTLLIVYLVVLYVIPSDRSIAALGAAGSLSVVFGCGVLVVWGYFIINSSAKHAPLRPNPVRVLQTVFIVAVLASYVVAMTRAIPFNEISTADTGLIRTAAWAGIFFITADGIGSLDRLEILLRRMVIAGTAIATLGIAQFATGLSFVDIITIPGLVQSDTYASITSRGGLVRSAGTSTHPLEYGLVLTIIFPLALCFALRDSSRNVIRRWLPIVVIALGMTLAGSRSAIIGLVIGGLAMTPVLSRRGQAWFAAVAVIFAGIIYIAAPRVFNNLRYLFVSTGDDPSSVSRTGSLGVVSDFVTRNPLFGRGFGTFQPQYQILDNQYLLVLVETGLFGALSFLGISIAAIVCSTIAARRAKTPLERNIGAALAGAVAGGAVLMTFFDGLSFPQAAGSLFLVLGIAAAYWRLERPAFDGAASAPVIR